MKVDTIKKWIIDKNTELFIESTDETITINRLLELKGALYFSNQLLDFISTTEALES